MQSVSSRTWTHVAVFISCDDNHYTTGTSFPSCFMLTNFIHFMQYARLIRSVALLGYPYQVNLILFLCLHFEISLLCLFISHLESLKLIILIFFSTHKLHLQLNLFAVEDCLIIFHFIWGVYPRSFKLQNYFERAVWYLSRRLEKEYRDYISFVSSSS